MNGTGLHEKQAGEAVEEGMKRFDALPPKERAAEGRKAYEKILRKEDRLCPDILLAGACVNCVLFALLALLFGISDLIN